MHFHQKILKYLLEYRENHNNSFNFLVRQRSSVKDKKYPGGKFAHGLVFQGTNDYCFVALSDKSGGANATKSVGIVIRPTKNNSFTAMLEIVFPGETNQKLIAFYKGLASKFEQIKWDNKGERAWLHIGDFPEDDPTVLYYWLDKNFPIIRETALQSGIVKLIPDEKRFKKLQDNLEKRLLSDKKPRMYWIFQGNPDIYNITNALKAAHLKSWKVAAHKDKIKVGDHVILWQTGDKAGCYALAEVTSEVGIFKEEAFEQQYYINHEASAVINRVKIKITKYLADNPILWEDIKYNPTFSDFKAGNQGTNFSATEEEFNALLNWNITNNTVSEEATKYNLKMKAINQILYGPPGTGKTFYLKDQLFDRYTLKENAVTKEKYFEEIVTNLTWWQVITLALIEIGTSKVNAILENRWVAKKAALSESKNVRATIWGTLQMHTIAESETVAYKQRQNPLIFDKTKDKLWMLLNEEVKEQIPEIFDILKDINDFEISPQKAIKNFDFVTFHQSFAYEDFIEGIKPILPETEGEEAKDLGYTIEDGVFKQLCAKAKNDPDNRYAIFIDEINRGNVSAIFGELITLIELDKRKGAKNELSIKLPYSKKEFSVPSNLDIYGTMNTADRSVEALDTALRRRFEFKEMMPDYSVIQEETVGGVKLSEVLEKINQRIELLIDRDHTIGHSYFVNVNTPEKLAKAFNNKIVPLLQEYFYGDYGKIGLVLGKGFVAVIDNKDIEFASFKYENANDYKIPSYQLISVKKDTVIEAVELLLGKKEFISE